MRSWFAVTAPGLEEVCRAELAGMGLAGARAVAGGVEFMGPLEAGMRANLWSRTASRVLLRVAEFQAPGRRELAAGARKVRLEDFRAPGQGLRIVAASSKSRVYHTGMVEEVVGEALGSGSASGHGSGSAPGVRSRGAARRPRTEPAHRVGNVTAPPDTEPDRPAGTGASASPGSLDLHVRLDRDHCTLALDTSGELLHKRGYRVQGGRAPLRETLAAGMLLLAGWDPSTPLCDPMCGSGTFLIEGALLALGRAPGAGREFAFQHWPAFPRPAWEALLAETSAQARAAPPILGSDKNAGALGVARRNAARAGVEGAILFERRDAALAAPPPGAKPGLLVANPPYGLRLGDRREAREAATALGRALRERFHGWRAAIVSAGPEVEAGLGLLPERSIPLHNGGVPVRLLVGSVP